MTGTGWTCNSNTCTRSDALSGGASYPAITVTVNVAGNATSPQTNSVTASGGGGGNASATDATVITPVADLTVAGNHTGNFTQGQTGAIYNITVSNSGNGPTSGTVTMTETIPTGLTLVSMSGVGWTCPSGGTACMRSDALAAGASYPAITVLVNVSNAAPASVTNTAAVSGGSETNTANDQATDTTTIVSAPTGAATSIWPVSAVPANPSHSDSAATTGVKFRSDVSGYITGIRFYKGLGNNGTHIGLLYTAGGTLLSQAVFSGETVSGWQQVAFAAPVAIAANTTYVAAYFRNSAFAYDSGYFTGTGVDSAPLHALRSGVDGLNGVYAYGASPAFPVNSWGDTNYWVDVVFSPTAVTPVADLTVAGNHTGNFTQGQTGAIYNITVSNSGNGPTSGTVTMTETIPTGLTLVSMSGVGWTCPSGGTACMRSDALAAGASYPAITVLVNVSNAAPASVTNTAAVSGGSETNTANDQATDTTTIVSAPTGAATSIWPVSAVPANPSHSDSAATTGVKFRSDVSGYITGIRFYKGLGNNGTHIGLLYTAGGTLLSQAVFSGETVSGWQQVAFAAPVAIAANTTYVAAYFRNSAFAYDSGYFTGTGVDSAPLHALRSGVDGLNGVYAYGASPAFPVNSWGDTNYWVDVVSSDSRHTGSRLDGRRESHRELHAGTDGSHL